MSEGTLCPTPVSSAHSYTREDVPWDLADDSAKGGRLCHYLAGGGLKTFGRTIAQQVAARKHTRFWITSGVLAALWLLFYLI